MVLVKLGLIQPHSQLYSSFTPLLSSCVCGGCW